MSLSRINIFLFTFIILIGCAKNSPEKFSPEFVTKYKLDIPEPSDLNLNIAGNALWTVSDSNSTVYKISFEGKVLKSFAVDGIDLEGIVQIDENKLAVILERVRTILIVDTNGTELNRIKLAKEGEPNLGFEGIAFNPVKNHLYVINEKDPGELIELDSNYNIIKETELNFAKDYSGINYNSENNGFWIISDESHLLAQCDINGVMVDSFNFNLIQIEGVAVDQKNRLIYLVSDPAEELYVFKY